MAKPKIFVSWPGYSPDDPETGRRLVEAGYELLLHPRLVARSEDELAALMDGAVAAIVSTDPFTEKAIGSNPHLGLIARIGVGIDSIDYAAAVRQGVLIAITPGLNAEAVADHALALILALIRKVVPQDQSVKAGRWERIGPLTPSELPGKTVGLVGAGTIGRSVMRRLAGFGVDIVYYDAFVDALPGARKVASLAELLAVSDIVSLHAPLTPETRHIIDAAALARMKPTALLINTARGPLVDQGALFDALKAGAHCGSRHRRLRRGAAGGGRARRGSQPRLLAAYRRNQPRIGAPDDGLGDLDDACGARRRGARHRGQPGGGRQPAAGRVHPQSRLSRFPIGRRLGCELHSLAKWPCDRSVACTRVPVSTGSRLARPPPPHRGSRGPRSPVRCGCRTLG